MITIKTKINEIFTWLTTQRGNVIAYIALVLIIFGVLGGVMASLLTSSVTSSASPNYSRRALYMTEAGMRYGLSELRNAEDWKGKIEELNTTTYTLNPTETFDLNIFSPWYESTSSQDKTAGQTLTLMVPRGEVPEDYNIPVALPRISIINFAYTWEGIKPTSSAEIQGYTRIDESTIEIEVADSFVVSPGENVCIAVPIDAESTQPGNTPILAGDTLYVAYQARDIFPKYGGAFEIGKIEGSAEPIDRSTYFYDERVDDQANNRVELRNLTGRPDSKFPFVAELSDYAIFSPRNYIIIPTGASETISAGGILDEGIYVYDATQVDPTTPLPLPVSDFNVVESHVSFISQNLGQNTINIGSGYAPPAGDTVFGAAWYDADQVVGGDQNFCQAGECKFGLGARFFFTLLYSGDGDGVTFALTNGGNNSSGSVGGDIEQSELLGYAGDSRTNIAGTAHLDGSGNGLQSPKMAVEFDTLTNFDNAFETTPSLNYCVALNLKPDTRKDPLSNDRDAVQYVFWGSETLAIPCRNDDPSYDDNRHDAEGDEATLAWTFDTGIAVQSSPTFDSTDDTIYFGTNGSLASNFYGVNFDGSLKWQFNAGNFSVTSTPALDTVGAERRVYFTAADGKLYAMKANPPTTAGVQIWARAVGGTNLSSPAVDDNHNIYVGSSNDNIYAISSANVQLWARDLGQDIESSPVVDNTGGAFDGTIYIGRDKDGDLTGGRVFSFDAAGNFNPNWGGTFGDAFITDEDVDSKPALSKDGSKIYAVDDIGTVYAINASDGSQAWREDLSRAVNFINPAVDTSGGSADGTIYVPTDSGRLFALNPDGTRKPDPPWPINFGVNIESSPTVGPDGVIYIGTTDGKLHAINPDGSIRWTYPPAGGIGAVQSSPAIGDDGTVYFGSDDFNLYAITPFARPRNLKNLLVTSFQDGGDIKVGGEIVDATDIDNWLAGDGVKSWAVRIEVLRSLVLNAGGNYDYLLRTWVRQCDQIDCSDVFDTFYQDVRIEYRAKVPHIEQAIELVPADHVLFDRFLFGFTGATGESISQSAIFGNISWWPVGTNDAIITTDLDWP